MTRTTNSIKNIKYSLFGQVFGLIANFITRMVFVRVLGAEYLGLNGLFTNILSILSFAELGIGPAIVYSMYKPLADKDEKSLQGLMKLYKTAYVTIGILILTIGGILTPFLSFFIKDMPDISNISLIYLMFVVNTASTYFFSYKRSFLIADQKKYLDSLYRYSYFVLRSVLQIIILLLTKNFILYLSIQLLITFAENYTISKRVDGMYPFLQSSERGNITPAVKGEIVRNVKAMVFHKLGSVIVMGTDNILISKIVGLVAVGLYSNYLLIITALNEVFSIMFQSITASVGNLGATEDKKRGEFIFRCVDLMGVWIYGFASIALITLFNPFIDLWLGTGYTFPIYSVLLIVISFYLTGRRKSVLTFRDALGLFWYDRYKPILESIINLLASIYLAWTFGFEGVILGTIISTITTSFWIEPQVLYKYGFNMKKGDYFIKYSLHTAVIVVVGFINFKLAGLFNPSFIGFLGKLLITAAIPNILFYIAFRKTEEFQFMYNLTVKRILDRFNRKSQVK